MDLAEWQEGFAPSDTRTLTNLGIAPTPPGAQGRVAVVREPQLRLSTAPAPGGRRVRVPRPAYSQVMAASTAETISSKTPSEMRIRSMLMSVV